MDLRWKGSFTIEAAVILPLIFTILMGTVYVMFYYHDKILVNACAHQVLTEKEGEACADSELEHMIQQELKGQTLLFRNITVEVHEDKKNRILECSAKQNLLHLQIRMQMAKTAPEEQLRLLGILEKAGKQK